MTVGIVTGIKSVVLTAVIEVVPELNTREVRSSLASMEPVDSVVDVVAGVLLMTDFSELVETGTALELGKVEVLDTTGEVVINARLVVITRSRPEVDDLTLVMVTGFRSEVDVIAEELNDIEDETVAAAVSMAAAGGALTLIPDKLAHSDMKASPKATLT